ncbi:Protein FAM186A [Merluccius polli]|uniref:Protein FAM186A n=1 Tax=Merluccius polli TaxID=89951 RepID=A0AA47N2G3_MERPO|nr:Protein FAM186A [Merluccius polli]
MYFKNYTDPDVLCFSWFPGMNMLTFLRPIAIKDVKTNGNGVLQVRNSFTFQKVLDLPKHLFNVIRRLTYNAAMSTLEENVKLRPQLKARTPKRISIQSYVTDPSRKHALLGQYTPTEYTSGLQHLVECVCDGESEKRFNLCTLCQITLRRNHIINHVISFDHVYRYINTWHPATLQSKHCYKGYTSFFKGLMCNYAKQAEESSGMDNNIKQVTVTPDEFNSLEVSYSEGPKVNGVFAHVSLVFTALGTLETINRESNGSSLITTVRPGDPLVHNTSITNLRAEQDFYQVDVITCSGQRKEWNGIPAGPANSEEPAEPRARPADSEEGNTPTADEDGPVENAEPDPRIRTPEPTAAINDWTPAQGRHHGAATGRAGRAGRSGAAGATPAPLKREPRQTETTLSPPVSSTPDRSGAAGATPAPLKREPRQTETTLSPPVSSTPDRSGAAGATPAPLKREPRQTETTLSPPVSSTPDRSGAAGATPAPLKREPRQTETTLSPPVSSTPDRSGAAGATPAPLKREPRQTETTLSPPVSSTPDRSGAAGATPAPLKREPRQTETTLSPAGLLHPGPQRSRGSNACPPQTRAPADGNDALPAGLLHPGPPPRLHDAVDPPIPPIPSQADTASSEASRNTHTDRGSSRADTASSEASRNTHTDRGSSRADTASSEASRNTHTDSPVAPMGCPQKASRGSTKIGRLKQLK